MFCAFWNDDWSVGLHLGYFMKSYKYTKIVTSCQSLCSEVTSVARPILAPQIDYQIDCADVWCQYEQW